MLQDMESIEVKPHRVGRIRQAPVCEGIGREEIAELVMDDRLWNWLPWKNCQSCEHGRESDPDDDRALSSGDPNRPNLNRAKPTIAHQRSDPAHQAQDDYPQANDKRHESSS
jgi:hypothetical protein